MPVSRRSDPGGGMNRHGFRLVTLATPLLALACGVGMTREASGVTAHGAALASRAANAKAPDARREARVGASTRVELLSAGGAELRRQFNADRSYVRLLMLLSPT